MKMLSFCLATGLALAFASPASAQNKDVAYCHALAGKYQEYLSHGAAVGMAARTTRTPPCAWPPTRA